MNGVGEVGAGLFDAVYNDVLLVLTEVGFHFGVDVVVE